MPDLDGKKKLTRFGMRMMVKRLSEWMIESLLYVLTR
jgi:hypothetical protein